MGEHMSLGGIIFEIAIDHQYFLYHLMTPNLNITQLFNVCIFSLFLGLVFLPGIFSLPQPLRLRQVPDVPVGLFQVAKNH